MFNAVYGILSVLAIVMCVLVCNTEGPMQRVVIGIGTPIWAAQLVCTWINFTSL